MLKRFIAPVVLAGAVLGGAATAGAASAATPPAASATATTGHHALKSWLRAHRRQIRTAAVAISAKTIGVTPQALVTELKAGKSVAEVANEHGVQAQLVINALVGAADARIDTAVADHKLSAAQAATIKAALPVWVTKAVNHVF